MIRRNLRVWGCALVIGGVAAPAWADVAGVVPLSTSGDGVYGRFDGDIDLGVGAGVRAGAPGVGPNLRLSGHFLHSVGLVVDFTWPLDVAREWSLGTAIDVRPLFIPRWVADLEQGPAFWDLLLDSLSVSAGPVFHPNPTHRVEVGLGVEVGFAVPLAAHAHGFWLQLRGSGRWLGEGSPWGGLVCLAWQAPWLSPVLK